MFVLGHVGIGVALGAPRVPGDTRTLRFLILGTLLPDLVDKPLYYALSFATGRTGAELGLISSTRTFGHTLLFCLLLYAILPRRMGVPLAAGMITHLFLDDMGDVFGLLFHSGPRRAGPDTAAAILFPAFGFHFPILPFSSASEHVRSLVDPYTISGEVLGAVLIYLNRARLRAALHGRAAPG
jgi:LexA-binding, inner membrane-associated putative hydrolase